LKFVRPVSLEAVPGPPSSEVWQGRLSEKGAERRKRRRWRWRRERGEKIISQARSRREIYHGENQI
jgi:hypothetical protein